MNGDPTFGEVIGGRPIAIARAGGIQYLPTFVQTSLGASTTSSGLATTPQCRCSLHASYDASAVLQQGLPS